MKIMKKVICTFGNKPNFSARDKFACEEEKYHNIFDNHYIPMLIIDDKTGKIVDVNVAACEYYGYDKNKILTMKISDINVLSPQEVTEQMEIAKSEARKLFRFKHKLLSGEIRDVEVYSGPVKVNDRTLLFSVIHDVKERDMMETKFRVQESYFKYLFENSPEAIALLDNEFKIINVNKSFEEIFLYSIDEVKYKNITKVLCEERFYDESMYLKDCIKRGEFIRKETLRKRKDERLIDVFTLGFPIMLNGKQIGVYFIYSDLSRVKEEEHKKRLFSEIFKNNTVGVVITDSLGNIQWINKSFTEITGYSAEEAEGQRPSILKSGRHDNEYYSNMWNSILNIGRWQGQICNKRKNGEIYEEWLNIIAIKDDYDNIEYFVGMISDITDARQKEKKIEILTSKDTLTNLYNRDFFMNKLNYSISNNLANKDYMMAVLFIDIDDFKDINDNLGHLAGDSILKEFAVRLKTRIREYDIAARFGGDEFVILLYFIKDTLDTEHIAADILEEIKKPYFIDGNELHLTASIGIAVYPKDGADSSALMKNADIAMYTSKQSMREKITIFRSAFNKEIQENFKIKNSLRNAIVMNELFIEYQPMFNIKDKRIIAVEALLRWKYNNSRLIPPSTFIPIAEKNGMIFSIGEWVLEKACKQNRVWQDMGYEPVCMSVNVSVLQLEQANFPLIVERILKKTELSSEFLELEITETIFTKDHSKIVMAIKKLKKLGVKIVIDDFGTGYSSLGKLSELEINKLKIDKSFIDGVDENANKSKIVRAIISMAESLSLELTAEGVEKDGQLDFLRRNGCRVIQGYIFSKPVSEESIQQLLVRS